MNCIGLRWAIIALLIGTGFAVDIPYVFDNNTSNVAGYSSEQLQTISSKCTDLIGVAPFYIAQSGEVADSSAVSKKRGPANRETWTIHELKNSYDSRIEPNNDFVRHKTKMLAAMYPGDRNVDQICSLFQYMREGGTSEKGWSYVNGPRGIHPPCFPNDTLKVGEAKGYSGVGDCNDFAVLMSTLIESLGGTTRIILTYNKDMNDGHAYAEVYLGKADEDQVANILNWLKHRYGRDKVFGHINSTTKEVWMNLDWSADYPGGPFYKGDLSLDLRVREELDKTALKLTNDTNKGESNNWYQKGLGFFREEKYDEAINAWRKSTEIDPQDATAWFSIGCALGKLDKNDKALIAYDKALEINPKFSQVWTNKGYTYHILGNHDMALQCYDNAIQLDAEDALTWDNKAYALMDLRMYEQALLAVDEAININPKFAKAWNRKGTILCEMGNYNEALTCLDKALDLDPSEARSWNNKGWTLYLIGDYFNSIAFADKAIELDPNVSGFWDTKGAAYAGLGRHSEALAYYDEALRLDHNSGEAWYHKSNSLSALGRYAEANSALNTARSLGYDGP
jgi:tetratricopeptide (TPR) repeat protein